MGADIVMESISLIEMSLDITQLLQTVSCAFATPIIKRVGGLRNCTNRAAHPSTIHSQSD
jgi:hypothetical protein